MAKTNCPQKNSAVTGAHPTEHPTVFDLILDQSRDSICLQNIHGQVEWLNPAGEEMFGWSLAEARGKCALDFIHPPKDSDKPAQPTEFKYDLNSSIFKTNQLRQHKRRDGSLFWNRQSFSVIDLGTGDDQKKIVITCRDVTEQIETETALRNVQTDLEHAAHHDDLTGLANRKKLTDFLLSDAVRSAIVAGEIGVLQLDIDKFKDINDTLGHAAGDATICHVAQALHTHCGPDDLACRTGGDEFLLICLKSGTQEALDAKARQLLRAIKMPLIWKNQHIRISASIGTSLATSCHCTGEALIQQADQALYSAKSGGRGQVVLYTEALGKQHRDQQKMARDLKIALEEKQFEIFLQPQLCLDRNNIYGCEALIRWRHPEQGLLPPAAFLPTAEKCGLLAEIDYMSMNLSLDAFCALRDKGFANLTMSINVSSSILGDVNYPGLLDWAMQSRGIPAANICIEILESTMLDGVDLEINTAVERLKRLGVRVALDDFGTGYAGLAHISSFEIDSLKIDRSMISKLVNDPRNRVIVRSIIRLCDILGIKVVAEGVETQDQLEILRRAQCPLIQGYGLTRPMPVADTIDWLDFNTPLPYPIVFASAFEADETVADTADIIHPLRQDHA